MSYAAPLRLQASSPVASDPSRILQFAFRQTDTHTQGQTASKSPPRLRLTMLRMRRLTSALVLLAAVIAMSAVTTDAQLTFASMQKRRLRVRGSKRSADPDDDASRSSSKVAQQGVRGGGYSFADLPASSNVAGSSGAAQKQSASATVTTTADNGTAAKPLGKSQAAAVPLTPEVTSYSKDTDPKQSEPDTPTSAPSKAATATPAAESLGKSPAAAVPLSPTPTATSDDDTDPAQSDLDTPSSAKTPATTSLGESQVAAHPVELTSAPAPPAATDGDDDEDEDDEGSEEDDDKESKDETPVPSTDNASNPKQSDG